MFSDDIEKKLFLSAKYFNNQNSFNALRERYENLLNKISWDFNKRYPYLPLEFEDFYNYATYYFYYLIKNYDETSQKTFPIYIKTFLKFHVSNYIKKFQTKNNVFMNKMYSFEDDCFLNENTSDHSLDDIETIIKSLNFLTQSEKNILNLTVNELKPSEIADLLNKNTTSIYASISRIKKKIKKSNLY